MNQSEYKAITCSWGKAREHARVQVAIGLVLLLAGVLDPRPLLGLRASKAIHIDRSQNLALETSKRMLD